MPERSLVPSARDIPGAPYIGLLFTATLTLLVVGALGWQSVRELDSISADRAALNVYAEELRELRLAIQSTVLNGRGFAITGEQRELDAAIAAGRVALDRGDRVAELGRAYVPEARFSPLHRSLDSLSGRLQRLQLAERGGAELARALVRSGAGPNLVAALIASVDSLTLDADAMRRDLVQRNDAARLRLAVWLPVVATLGVAMGLLAVLLLRAQARARAQDLTRYRAIFDNTFQFTGFLSLDGRLLEANQTALAFGGLRPEDVIGKPFWEARWWSASQETQATLRAAIGRAAAGEFVRYHVEVVGEADRRITIDFSLKPVRDVDGKIRFLVPEGRDITALLAAERALEESEERWNFALSGSDLGVWDWNAVTNEVYFSDRWKSMLGFAPHEIGNTLDEWSKRVHPDDLAATMATVQAHLEGKTPHYVSIHRMRGKDGRWRDILDRGKVVSRTPDGRALRVIGTHQDITEQRAAEESARVLQQQLSALLKHSPSLIAVIDREGRYLHASESIATAIGRPVREIVGRRLEELLPPETVATFRTRLAQVERTGLPVDVEDSVGPEGSKRRYRTVLFPMKDEAGRIFAVGTVAINVTEAHEARLRLEQALDENRVLQGLLSICAKCKRIHDREDARWKPVESYVQEHSAAVFSHGLCPTCTAEFVKESGLDTDGPSAP